MRWTPSNLVSGMRSLFFRRLGGAEDENEIALNQIRNAMLDCLDAAGTNAHGAVERRVIYAHNLQDLWYLRGDLMAVLATTDGESAARRKVSQISDMFKGLLPQGLTSRPSPLGH